MIERSDQERVDLAGNVGFIVLQAASNGVLIPENKRGNAFDLEERILAEWMGMGPPRRSISYECPQ